MEFRLTYEGELFAANNCNPRATHKHDIRRCFHRQIKHLWEITPHLKEAIYPTPNSYVIVGDDFKYENRKAYLAKNFSMFGYQFVPLVTEDLALWCGLDILFLRAGSPGKVFSSGDIDNRIKTLFDALKLPRQSEQLGDYKDKGPSADEVPFFCLMEDDGLVAKVSVETDALLESLAGGIPSNSDARLIVTVSLRPATVMIANMGFV
jgi:hypothetical protein